ncbi:MAG: RidA family protein [Anaerolineae bacterium]|nr:RidA family protein [Anaerolineae bacterium]
MREVVSTDKAPAAVGAYSQAIKANGFVFTAGQLGLDPATGKLAEGGIEAQTRQALKNLGAILEAAGASFGTVVKVTVFLHNIDDFAAMNRVYKECCADPPPARSAIAVRDLPLGGLVEIEAMALIA